jgi:hypothetical protein
MEWQRRRERRARAGQQGGRKGQTEVEYLIALAALVAVLSQEWQLQVAL